MIVLLRDLGDCLALKLLACIENHVRLPALHLSRRDYAGNRGASLHKGRTLYWPSIRTAPSGATWLREHRVTPRLEVPLSVLRMEMVNIVPQ